MSIYLKMKVSLELFFVLPILVHFVLLYLSWSSAANFSKPSSVSLRSVLFYVYRLPGDWGLCGDISVRSEAPAALRIYTVCRFLGYWNAGLLRLVCIRITGSPTLSHSVDLAWARKFAFPARSQVMLTLLSRDLNFENHFFDRILPVECHIPKLL